MMTNTRWIMVLACLAIIGGGMVSALMTDGSVTASLSTVVGASLDDVTTTSSLDIAPSFDMKADASMSQKLDAEAQMIDAEATTSTTARVTSATRVDDELLTTLVPVDVRAAVLTRIAAIRADAVDRFDTRSVARARMADILRARAKIVARTGIDRDLDRIDFARLRAQEYGNTEVDGRLAQIRARLQASKDDGASEGTEADRRELDRVIWFQFANRLSTESDRLIAVAQKVDNSMDRALNQMDSLQTRIDASTRDPTAFARLDAMQSKTMDAKLELEAKMEASRVALAAFKADSTPANARALHKAMIEMKVAAHEGAQDVRLWVVYYNHLVDNGGRDVRNIWARIEPRLLTRAQIDARAVAEANDALSVSMYGNASVTGGV